MSECLRILRKTFSVTYLKGIHVRRTLNLQALVFFLFNILVYNGRNKFVMLSTFSIIFGMEIAESVIKNLFAGPINCGLASEAVLGAGLQMWHL